VDGWLSFSAAAYLGQLTLYDAPQIDNGTPSGSGTAVMAGLHAVGAVHLRRAYLGMSVVYEQSLTNFHGVGVELWRPGVTLGWGAPYGGGLLGVSATGGLLYSDTAQTAYMDSAQSASGGGAFRQDWNGMQYFGEIAGYVQLPRVLGLRAFVSPSGALVAKSSIYAPKWMFGAEFGMVLDD
jgi:hypothetical protein